MMRCIIVDDEKLALDLLESNISRVPFLKLLGKFSNPFHALTFLQNNQVDVMFIDIEMPMLSGLDMLQGLKSNTQVVMVTAYEQYAIAGFDLHVTDYLLKPVSFERFFKACLRCQEQFQHKQLSRVDTKKQSYFFVNVDYSQVKINYRDILYIESMRDYIKIVLKNDKPVITRLSLKFIEAKLEGQEFIRIHKSFIVNTDVISSLKKGIVVVAGNELPLSDNYRDLVVRRLRIAE